MPPSLCILPITLDTNPVPAPEICSLPMQSPGFFSRSSASRLGGASMSRSSTRSPPRLRLRHPLLRCLSPSILYVTANTIGAAFSSPRLQLRLVLLYINVYMFLSLVVRSLYRILISPQWTFQLQNDLCYFVYPVTTVSASSIDRFDQ